MKKQILFAACTLFAASALLMTSCQQAEEPIANDPTDQAGPMTRAATLGNFYRVVYVEVNDVNPLNAGEYLLSDGTPFFTHVILFASNIRGDASGNVHNYNNPNNAAILANPAKYIAPLQAKGIKVIMGNLGDHTGAGFANLPQHKSVLTRMIWLPTTISSTATILTTSGRSTEPAAIPMLTALRTAT